MPTQSHIGRAIEELESERTHLAARLQKVNEAIATMRELFHLPSIAAPKAKGAPASNRANGTGHGNARMHLTDTAITAALKAGPMATRALAQAIGVRGGPLNYRLRALERDGVIHSTGAGKGKTVTLAGSAPAKEAP